MILAAVIPEIGAVKFKLDHVT